MTLNKSLKTPFTDDLDPFVSDEDKLSENKDEFMALFNVCTEGQEYKEKALTYQSMCFKNRRFNRSR